MKSDNHWVCLLTAVFVLGVVFLHVSWLTSYPQKWLYDLKINVPIARLLVGGFCFLSGYKLARSKKDAPSFSFIKNRLGRIYPPYILTVCLFIWIVEKEVAKKQVALHLMGLQIFLPELAQPFMRTIWFVGVLVLC